MFKRLRICYLSWVIRDLQSEIEDYRAISYGFNISMMMLRSHYYHKERFEPSELFERFQTATRSRIFQLKRKIVKIRNQK